MALTMQLHAPVAAGVSPLQHDQHAHKLLTSSQLDMVELDDLLQNAAAITAASSENSYSESKLGFLSLPAEVRNDIYMYLYRDAILGISTIHPFGPLCRSFCVCAFPWSLSHTCRLLRSETLPLLLSATTLEISNRLDKTLLLPALFRNTISRFVLDAKVFASPGAFAKFPVADFQSLRVLELRNVSVWCKYHDESYLESDEADECMYELARFNLRRINPELIKLCDIDEATRGFKMLLGCQFVGNSTSHMTVVSIRAEQRLSFLFSDIDKCLAESRLHTDNAWIVLSYNRLHSANDAEWHGKRHAAFRVNIVGSTPLSDVERVRNQRLDNFEQS